MRVAVIGSGIVGSSVGWNLAKQGAAVVMLDAGRPGAAVTNWSFSWFNASNKTQTREYFELNVAGMSEYRQLASELGQGDWFHPTGHLRWSDTAEGTAGLRQDVEHLQGWGYAAELWTAREVRGLLEPEVHFPSDEAEVALYPDEGWIGGRDLVALLVQGMSTNGATVRFGCPVVGLEVEGGRIVAVEMSDGQRIEVDAVVNAAGPAAGRVAGLVGRRLPMRDEPGLVARVRVEARPVRRAMHAPHVEIRPDGLGRVVLHSPRDRRPPGAGFDGGGSRGRAPRPGRGCRPGARSGGARGRAGGMAADTG